MSTDKISLCITNHNRTTLLQQSFQFVHHDPLIDEILIRDDNSNPETVEFLYRLAEEFPKVRLIFNNENVGMSYNKYLAILAAKNNWCIIFDSDNVLQQDYLHRIRELGVKNLRSNTIYCPDAALPNFIYSEFAGMVFDRDNAKDFLGNGNFGCFLNTCNYLVNRDTYVFAYEYNGLLKGSDTAYFNYKWLEQQGKFEIVRGMTYFHRVHEGSGWKQDADYNSIQFEMIKDLIRNL